MKNIELNAIPWIKIKAWHDKHGIKINNLLDIPPNVVRLQWSEELEGLLEWHPHILGDSEYYAKLATVFPWYYQKSKHEFKFIIDYLKQIGDTTKHSLLEIGSGSGHFYQQILEADLNVKYKGIDLSQQAITQCNNNFGKGIFYNLDAESILSIGEKFDIVLSTQLVEHLENPVHFFQSIQKLLTANGIIITSIPSGESFMRYEGLPLNCPPHHQAIWTKQAAISLAKLLNMNLDIFYTESIAPEHSSTFIRSLFRNSQSTSQNLLKRFLRKSLLRILSPILAFVFKDFNIPKAYGIAGHSSIFVLSNINLT